MRESKHTDDIRNIAENDQVVIESTEGGTLNMTCIEIKKSNARNPEIIRENTTWHFDLGGDEVIMTRVEGLRESEEMEPFPHDKEIWDLRRDESLGYAESLKILGPRIDS